MMNFANKTARQLTELLDRANDNAAGNALREAVMAEVKNREERNHALETGLVGDTANRAELLAHIRGKLALAIALTLTVPDNKALKEVADRAAGYTEHGGRARDGAVFLETYTAIRTARVNAVLGAVVHALGCAPVYFFEDKDGSKAASRINKDARNRNRVSGLKTVVAEGELPTLVAMWQAKSRQA
jgi:hypothetical protein